MKKCVYAALAFLLLLRGCALAEGLIAPTPAPELIPVATPSPTPPVRTNAPWRYAVGPTGVTIIAYEGRDAQLTVPETLLATLTVEQAYALYQSSDTDAGLRAQLLLQRPDIANVLVRGQGDVELLLPVVAIADQAFMNNEWIRSVFVPDCVQTIGKEAFSHCSNLMSVRLPDGLVRIENNTFEYCYSLAQIEIPSTVTLIGTSAFSHCSRLTSVRLPERISTIRSRAFYKCIRLADVYIPSYLENLGTRVFYDTVWLKAQTDEFVVVGRGILLRYNGKDTAVHVPANVRTIVDAFMDNRNLAAVSMSESVEIIGYFAFSGCTMLSQVQLSSKATQVQDYAFENCTSLIELQLPEKLESIGEAAFSGCKALAVCSIPETVREIGASAFQGCASLTRARIPLGVTSLGETVFSGCRSLVEVSLPRTLMFIARTAFSGAKPTAYVAEGSYAETYARQKGFPCVLVSETAPTPVPSPTAPPQRVEGFEFERIDGEVTLVRCTLEAKSIELPSNSELGTPTAVGTGAFAGREGTISVTIPEGYTTVKDGAFSAMEGQISFMLPASLSRIGERAFAGTDAVLIAPAGSAAQNYAQSAGMLFIERR